MSDLYQSLSHSKWDCKYHVVFVPKRRRKAIYGPVRRELGKVFHGLAKQKECRIMEGHLMPDHVHMCIEIPPKHSGGVGDRVFEREECDSHCSVVREGKELQLAGTSGHAAMLYPL